MFARLAVYRTSRVLMFGMKVALIGIFCVAGISVFVPSAHASGCTVEFFDNANGSWRLACSVTGVKDNTKISDAFAKCSVSLASGSSRKDGRTRFAGWSSWPGASTANISVVGSDAIASGLLRVYSVHVKNTLGRVGRVTVNGALYWLRQNLTAVYLRPVGAPSQVRIPDSVKYDRRVYRVTELGDSAFRGRPSLKKVSFGANVRTVGSRAFEKCVRLKKVNGLSGLRTISKRAFYGCKRLKRFACTSSELLHVGAYAFSGCSRLTQVTFKSKKLSSIGKGAFRKCTKLRRVTCRSPKITSAMLQRAEVL